MKKYILFLMFLLVAFFVQAQQTPPSYPIDEILKIQNGAKSQKEDLQLYKKGTEIIITADAKSGDQMKNLKENEKRFVVYQKENMENITIADSNKLEKNGVALHIDLDQFNTLKEKSELILAIKNNKGKLGKPIYTFITKKAIDKPEEITGNPEDDSEPKETAITELIRCSGLKFALKNITPADCCCCDNINPCDLIKGMEDFKKSNKNSNDDTSKHSDQTQVATTDKSSSSCESCIRDDSGINKYKKNRIVFFADPPELMYYNYKGKNFLIGSHKPRHQNIKINPSDPLTFEVRNVNPEAFDISIADIIHREELESNSLIGLLSLGEKLAEQAPTAQKEKNDSLLIKGCKTLSPEEKIKVALYLVGEALQGFIQQLSTSCTNKHNSIIALKIDAKKSIDSFITAAFKGQHYTFLSLLPLVLDPEKKEEASTMQLLKDMYAKISVNYYRHQYTIPSIPSGINKIEFKLSILKKEGTPYINLVKDESINAYVVNTWRPEITSGLYYAWFKNAEYGLRDDSLSKKDINGNDSVYTKGKGLYKLKDKQGEFGFSSFIHFSYRASAVLSLSPFIGAGVNFSDKPRPRYFTGGGIVIGKESRIAINGGFAFGNVDEDLIDNRYTDVLSRQKLLPASETEIDYKKKFASAGFISFSYKLPIGKSKETLTAAPTAEDAAGTAETETPEEDAATTDSEEESDPKTGEAKPETKVIIQQAGSSDVKELFKKAKKIKFKG